jgi:cytochrome c oxidase subunit 1
MAEALAKNAYTGGAHAPAKKATFDLFARPTAKTGLVSWLTTVDHKKIGMLYGGFAIFFFLVGGLEALMIRTQLMVPNNHFISAQQYNEMFTMHGTTMIFLAVMPLNGGVLQPASCRCRSAPATWPSPASTPSRSGPSSPAPSS